MEHISYSGSIWRKWDLHIHTNASDGTGTVEQIIDEAVEKGLSVIAITDHHTFGNIDEAKRIGAKRGINVISGIEFRTEFGSRSVHMIGLFPEEYNGIKLTQNALEQMVLGKLGLTRVEIEAKGKALRPNDPPDKLFMDGVFAVQVSFKEAANVIHELGGLVSVHAGDKGNSIEEMKHDGRGPRNVSKVEDSLGPVKEELLNNYIDICELSGGSDDNASFYLKTFNKPSIAASDAHKVDEVGREFAWIKSDTSFEGLRQIIYEPEARVRIQTNIPEMKSEYQIIDSILIDHPDFGKQEIPFNANLNAIIGGRSSGKSILLGCIAKLAKNNRKVKKENEKYEEYLTELVKCMSLKWRDASDVAERKVEYFPQSYINGLASQSKETMVLIENILKGDLTRKAAYETYNSLQNKNVVEISNAIENYFQLKYRESDLKSERESTGDLSVITKEVERLSKQCEEVKAASAVKLSDEDEKQHEILKNEDAELKQRIAAIEGTDVQLQSLELLSIVKEISADIVGLPEAIKNEIYEKYSILSNDVQQRWKGIIQDARNQLQEKLKNAKERIKTIEECEIYIKGEQYYKENEAIEELNRRIDNEKKKANRIKEINLKLDALSLEIAKTMAQIKEKRILFYSCGQELCEKVLLAKEDVQIASRVVFDFDRFVAVLENNLIKRSSFVSSLFEYEFSNLDDFETLITSIVTHVEEDKISLKNGHDKKQTLIELLSSNYFAIEYDVLYQGDTLSSMSEGKKAFVILRMLLDFDDSECPILIDQPEDDLDNRAIYNDLVSYFREKKINRQIIVVTHNPNVVVGADAEEVIVANQHGIKNENQDGVKFEYRAGAIENSSAMDKTKPVLISQGIREHICDILEGGDVAFKKRESKYGFELK